MNWNTLVEPLMRHFRRKRLKAFVSQFPELPNMEVLDVGGRLMIWELIEREFGISPKRLVILNHEEEKANSTGGCEFVVGDGRDMVFSNDQFDLVFSNSVIEHVGDMSDMKAFASELCRVGRHVYVQTPNKWFPIEPHIIAFFIHWLPRGLYRRLSFLSLRWWSLRNNRDRFYGIFDHIMLLSRGEVSELFPGMSIVDERFMLMSKSFVVTGKAQCF